MPQGIDRLARCREKKLASPQSQALVVAEEHGALGIGLDQAGVLAAPRGVAAYQGLRKQTPFQTRLPQEGELRLDVDRRIVFVRQVSAPSTLVPGGRCIAGRHAGACEAEHLRGFRLHGGAGHQRHHASAGPVHGVTSSLFESGKDRLVAPYLTGENHAMKPADHHELFRRLHELNPHPTTELIYTTPFELLIAVILSAQATDVGVNKATRRLYPVANTAEAILALGEAGLKRYISSIGLFNAKAKNVIATCRILVEQYGGAVPRERTALEALPGVGRKTANVVLNTAFGEATMAVDTHIFRVANRTGLAKGKTPLAVEKGLLKHVPTEFLKDAHHWLILHGRYVCKALKPQCPTCVIRDLCGFRSKTPGVPR